MQYRIRLIQSDEGWAVSCPSLPGCHSEGATREEAVEHIKAAIQEWLQVEAEESGVSRVEEDLVVIWAVPKLPGISRATAVRVFTKLGFRIAHEGKHTVMSNGKVRLTIPRHNSINPFTMASIAKDASLTPEQFRELMWRTMSESFDYDVFLSHSAKDKAVVGDVAERLRKDGVKVWFDEWVPKPGDSIPAKNEEGLERSRVLVLCMSAHAFGSDWAQLESGTFRFRDPLNKERRFLPLRLDDTPIKGSLAQFLYINWLPEPVNYMVGSIK